MALKKNDTKEKTTLAMNITKLIATLETHQKRHNVNERLLVISTILLAIVTGLIVYSSVSDSDSRRKVEKMTQTIQICKDYNDWNDYKSVNSDSLLREVRNWTRGEGPWHKDSIVDPKLAMEKLQKNRAIVRLFNYFETAKMLDKKGLLDTSYFNNWFSTLFTNLEYAKNPSVDEFIKEYRIKRKKGKNQPQTIWDGYTYYRNDVINLDRILVKDSVSK
jgi:hypothetical protein